jgi:drug/metabolite transporter (DMT)-like permease
MSKIYLSYATLYMSACLFAVNSVIVKIASEHYSGIFISSIRFLFGIIFTVSAILISGEGFRINNKKYWVLRGVAGAAAMISFYVAIHLTSSGRTAMIEKIYPIFVTILGFLLFREKITKGIIVSLVLCTAGLFFIMYDGSSYNIVGDLIAILAGIAASFAIIFIKKARETDSSLIIYLSPCIFGMATIPFSFHEFSLITTNGFFLLFLIGFLTFAAQVMMTYGYKEVPAAKGSIIFYLETVVTILLSLVIVNEVITARFIIGCVLVMLGLIINNSPKLFRLPTSIKAMSGRERLKRLH